MATTDMPRVESSHGLAKMLDVLADNERLAQRTLNMVPSENALSGIAKLPLLLDVHHRYFFNEELADGSWHFRGAQNVAALETQLILPLLRELAQAQYVTVRPLSGLSAMTLVLAALGGPPGSTVLTVPLGLGGHYATAQIARRMGLSVQYLPGADPHTVNLEATADLVVKTRPTLIYIDQSSCLFPIDVSSLVEAVRSANTDTLVHVDASHWLGLVLGGEFDNPLASGADSFGGSTHKTFPGPQKAIVVTDRGDIAKSIDRAQEFLISSHHLGASLSLGIALLQFAEFGRDYASRVVAGTQRFGRKLHELGLTVSGSERGFSAGHQLWLDTEADGVPAPEASDRLFAAGIRTNFLPGLPGFGQRQALRIGLNEPIYRGLDVSALDDLSKLFALGVRAEEDTSVLATEVQALRRGAKEPLAATGTDEQLIAAALRLCAAALLDDELDPTMDPSGAIGNIFSGLDGR